MQIAKQEHGKIIIADHRTMFSGTSFPKSGPDSQWLADNGCYPVSDSKMHDQATQKLVPAEPYMEDGQVFTVQVVDLTEDELASNLVTTRTAKWEGIKAERDRRIQTGGYQAAGKWFHSDPLSRNQQLVLSIMGTSITPGLMWKTMDGSFIEMTPSIAQQVVQASVYQDNAIFQHAEILRTMVNNSPDPHTIDITSGWPLIFGE